MCWFVRGPVTSGGLHDHQGAWTCATNRVNINVRYTTCAGLCGGQRPQQVYHDQRVDLYQIGLVLMYAIQHVLACAGASDLRRSMIISFVRKHSRVSWSWSEPACQWITQISEILARIWIRGSVTKTYWSGSGYGFRSDSGSDPLSVKLK
jgi:hypothetical protein